MALFSWNLYVKLLFTACVRAEYFFNHGNTLTLCGDPNMKFLSFGNISLSSCITECGRRPKCFALNHRPLYSNFCELFETRDTIANVNRDCLYIRRDDISFSDELSNGCGCAVGEACDLQSTTCSKSECFPLRTLANGKLIGNKYGIGNSLAVQCNQGFESLNGVTSVTCLSTGEWSQSPMCSKVCNPPAALQNGIISGIDYSEGSTLDVTCYANYYEVSGIHSITCLSSAVWSAVPSCALQECSPPPSLTNGEITGSVYTIGSSLTVQCNSGFREESNITSIECSDILQWNLTPTCVLRECDYPPSFQFGQLSSSVAYTVGTTLSILCDNGYQEINGRPYITCLETSSWDFIPECTVIECSVPTLSNGMIFGDQYTVGSTVYVTCNTNYIEINSISTITCMANGYWDNTPYCVASSSCPSNWIQVGSSCFYVSVPGDGDRDFSNAEAFCIGEGGNLARLDTYDKYDAVRTELNGRSNTVNNYWFGLRKHSNNGEMKWLDNGESYSYHNFASGEPGTNNEYCAFLWKNDGWKWHAGVCSWSNRFLCEKLAS